MKLTKKAQAGIQMAISGLLVLVVGLVIVGLVASYGAKVQEDVRDDVTGTAGLIANLSLNNTYDVMEDTDTIASVGIAVIIIGLILAAFGGFMYFKTK